MIKKGVSTQKEVQGLFGAPEKITKNSDGSETWEYQSEDVVMKSFTNNTIWGVAGLVRSWIPSMILPPAMAIPMLNSLSNSSGYSTTILFNSLGFVTSIKSKR